MTLTRRGLLHLAAGAAALLAHMRIPRDQVLKVLEPSEGATPRQPYRPQRANVG
jgi:hypothetical protein